MIQRGDTEKQAILRDGLIKKGGNREGDPFVLAIRAVLQLHMAVLDIGCGTAHILETLAKELRHAFFIGLDISPAMLKIASENVIALPNTVLVEGDGMRLPFADCSFDTVITRLAEYLPAEAYRVLKQKGYFFEYGLGPDANREILEFFSNRVHTENFFLPRYPGKWQEEVCEKIKDADFNVQSINDYKENEYYSHAEEVMDLIEMVPLVDNFTREKDGKIVNALSAKYREKRGIKITWHYYIVKAQRQ